MTDKPKPDETLVFGFAHEVDGAVCLLGVPDAAWGYMKDGKTQLLDLHKLGIPVKLILFGCRTQAEAIKVIEEHNAKQNRPVLRSNEDFSIKDGSVRKADLKNSTV